MTTLAQVIASSFNKEGPPDMTVLGPSAWAELHAWADRFKAKVGDSCGCGRFAQDAAKALHDVVSVGLGKPAMYPENLQEMAKVYQKEANTAATGGVTASSPYTITKQFAWAAATDAANRAMRKGRRSAWSLEDYNIAVRTFEELWPETATEGRNHRRAPQSGIEPWPEGMFEEDEEEEDEGMEQKDKASGFHNCLSGHDWIKLQDLVGAGKKTEALELMWNQGKPHHGKIRPARFSQSFIDTILHTGLAAATALVVTKVLNPASPDIKEGEKPQPAPSPVPAVLSPAHVEGDQANVDLGTLLEEIDAILKKPETMGIVDTDTLTIVRA